MSEKAAGKQKAAETSQVRVSVTFLSRYVNVVLCCAQADILDRKQKRDAERKERQEQKEEKKKAREEKKAEKVCTSNV
jgi:hypothetical protein